MLTLALLKAENLILTFQKPISETVKEALTLYAQRTETTRALAEAISDATKVVDKIHTEFEHIGAAAQAYILAHDHDIRVQEKLGDRKLAVTRQELELKEIELRRRLKIEAQRASQPKGQRPNRPGQDAATRPMAEPRRETNPTPLAHHIDPAKLQSKVEAPQV
jgi:type I site-specific restriction-modification system R (restriction) subunit